VCVKQFLEGNCEKKPKGGIFNTLVAASHSPLGKFVIEENLTVRPCYLFPLIGTG